MKKTFILSALLCLALGGASAYAEEHYAVTTAASQPSQNEESPVEMPRGQEDAVYDTSPDGRDEFIPPEANSPAPERNTSASEIGIMEEIPAFYGVRGHGDSEVSLEYLFHNNGYPDFVSYAGLVDKDIYNDRVYYQYEVGLTEITDENREYILSLLSDSFYVAFSQCRFSYNERLAAFEELRDSGERVDMSSYSEAVYVYIPDAELEQRAAEIYERYGGIVTVMSLEQQEAYLDGAVTGGGLPDGGNGIGINNVGIDDSASEIGSAVTTGINSAAESSGISPVVIWAVIAAVVLAAAAGLIFLVRRSALVTAEGRVVTSRRVSRGEIIAAVKSADETPQTEFNDIIAGIEKKD